MIQLIVEALISTDKSTFVLDGKTIDVIVSDSLSESLGLAAHASSMWQEQDYKFVIEVDKKYVDSYKKQKSPITRALVAHELGHIFSGRLTDGITNEIAKDEQEADCWGMQELIRNEDYDAITSLYEFSKRRINVRDEPNGYPGGETQIKNLDRCNILITR